MKKVFLFVIIFFLPFVLNYVFIAQFPIYFKQFIDFSPILAPRSISIIFSLNIFIVICTLFFTLMFELVSLLIIYFLISFILFRLVIILALTLNFTLPITKLFIILLSIFQHFPIDPSYLIFLSTTQMFYLKFHQLTYPY